MMSGLASGLASGIASSLPSGIETPDTMLNLRKASESEQPRQLYQVGGGLVLGRLGGAGRLACPWLQLCCQTVDARATRMCHLILVCLITEPRLDVCARSL